MTASFHLLQPTYKPRDERLYIHRVRVASVKQGSSAARHRFTFYPDNGLRWHSNEPARADDGRTEYGFPDEATARKFADRFSGEYVGAVRPALAPPVGIASKTS